MNKSKILVPQKRFGAIKVTNFTGGEVDWEKIIPEANLENASPEHYEFFKVKELREFAQKLKVERAQIPKPYKLENGVLRVSKKEKRDLDIIDSKIKRIYEVLNDKNKSRFKKVELKNISIIYEVENPGKSMIRNGITSYEVNKEKGDIMKNRLFIEEPEFENEFGIKEPTIYKECVLPYFKDGALKGHDLVVLHNSGRLGFEMNGTFVKTNEIEKYSTVGELLENVRKDGAKVVLPKTKNKTPSFERNNLLVDIDEVQRIEFDIRNDSQNGLAEQYLKDLRVKDSKMGFVPITKYDEDDHAYTNAWVNLLVFNKINYEENKIIIVGLEPQLEALQKRFDEKNEEGCYYNFSGQNLVSYKEDFKGRISQRKGLHIDDYVDVPILLNIRAKMHLGLNTPKSPISLEEITPKQFRRTEEGVVGLNEVSEDKDLKKYLRNFDFPGVPRDESEVKELFEIAEEVDGRLKQSNIEHELRRDLKYLKQKSSKELYFLLQSIEENQEFRHEVEIVNGKKVKKTIYNKKHMALRNVVQSYKMLVENHEEEAKGLTSDLKDLVTVEKDGFKANKKAKNLYDQQKGLLAPNQNPQRMEHIPAITPDELAFYKQEATLERREKQDIDNMLKVYKTVESAVRKDGSCTMVEILDVEATKALGGLSVGGRPHFPSSSKVSYLGLETKVSIKKEYPSKAPLWMLDTVHLSYKDAHLLQDVAVELQGYIPTRKFQEIIRYCVKGYYAGIGKESMPGWFCPPKEIVLKKSLEEIKDKKGKGWRIRNVYNRNSKMNETLDYDQPMLKEGEKPFVFEYVSDIPIGLPHYKGLKSRATFEVGHHDWVSTKRGTKNKEESSSSYSSISNYRVIDKEEDTYTIELKIDGITKTFYAQGNLKALQQQSIAVIGTRNPSIETVKYIKYGVKRLVQDGCVIVSGLAKGCDTIAHKSCLDAGGITIAVLPSGLRKITPYNNKSLVERILENNGLVLSQYEPLASAHRNTYLERNSVIANLSEEVLICEAGSGTMNTYSHAKRLGKQVYVQDIDSRYNKDLIENKDEDILLI